MSRTPISLASLTLSALLLAAGCGGERRETAQVDTASSTAASGGAAPVEARKIGTVKNLQNPESARWDAEQNVWFVSNVNGGPSAKDNNGYISRLKPDGSVDSLKFIAAGRNKVTLNAPKGMAIVGDTLWVADIDAVRGFNRKTGAPVASIAVPGAQFLNDVSAGPDGIYITDSGVLFGPDGTSTHPGPDRVFKVAGRKVTTALTFKGQVTPNGITWDSTASRFVVVPMGDSTIVSWAPGDSAPQPVATAPGMMDGVEALGGGRYLVTSWADSSLNLVADGKVTRLAAGMAAPADIGFDRAAGTVAVPQLTENMMELLDVSSVLRQ
jgi:sugar lactone lactonase YvrE